MTTFPCLHDRTIYRRLVVLCLCVAVAIIFLLANYQRRLVYVMDTPVAAQHGEATIPMPLVGLLENMNQLKGKHSDYISPSCGNKSGLPSITKEKYGFVGPFKYLKQYKNPCWTDRHGKLQCVPYFHVIGCGKCGSTDLFSRLVKHPSVVMGRAKETRWFSHLRFGHRSGFHKVANRSLNTFEDYLSMFRHASDEIKKSVSPTDGYRYKVLGEGSPTYYADGVWWRKVPGNEGCLEPRVTAISQLHHMWPQVKLVLILRNPVARLFSRYLFNDKGNNTRLTASQFDDSIRGSLNEWYRCLTENPMRACLYNPQKIKSSLRVRTGIYSRFVLDILKIFPRNQLYIVQMEHYSKHVKEYLRDIIRFLDLPPLSDAELTQISQIQRKNKGQNYKKIPEMLPMTRSLLTQFYAPYNTEMAEIMGDSRWLYHIHQP